MEKLALFLRFPSIFNYQTVLNSSCSPHNASHCPSIGTRRQVKGPSRQAKKKKKKKRRVSFKTTNIINMICGYAGSAEITSHQ